MFSKSAVNGIPKWQICFCFRRFYAFLRRKCEVCKKIIHVQGSNVGTHIYRNTVMHNNKDEITRLQQPSYMVAANDIK